MRAAGSLLGTSIKPKDLYDKVAHRGLGAQGSKAADAGRRQTPLARAVPLRTCLGNETGAHEARQLGADQYQQSKAKPTDTSFPKEAIEGCYRQVAPGPYGDAPETPFAIAGLDPGLNHYTSLIRDRP